MIKSGLAVKFQNIFSPEFSQFALYQHYHHNMDLSIHFQPDHRQHANEH